MTAPPRNVAILIFPGVELLDFAGPFEVFSAARINFETPERLFNVFTVAESREPLRCYNPVTVIPDYTLETCPPADILVVPGGYGTRSAVTRPQLIEWLRTRANTAEVMTSVCTGSFLLAQAGLLTGRAATTHWGSIQRLRDAYPEVEVREHARWVDEGVVVSSAGVSAGIDMALHIVARLYGADAARVTARWIEYDYWNQDEG
ncbi:MAG TPA: DJ-1/PfpI family protein [Chloroflexi bacterium]|nr:DJ-1/PfpI family protein [Chloroflexota bacterium]